MIEALAQRALHDPFRFVCVNFELEYKAKNLAGGDVTMAKRRRFEDLPHMPPEMLNVVRGNVRDYFFFEEAERIVQMYTNGKGNELSKEQFLGLFGRLFYVDPEGNGSTFKAKTGEDAVTLAVKFITAFQIEARRQFEPLDDGLFGVAFGSKAVEKAVYTTMYRGLMDDQCKWAAKNKLDARIADMRETPPHVVALIATWLNMVFIQSSEPAHLQRHGATTRARREKSVHTLQVYLTLMLMRYAILKAVPTTKEHFNKLNSDPLQRRYEDSDGKPRIVQVYNNYYSKYNVLNIVATLQDDVGGNAFAGRFFFGLDPGAGDARIVVLNVKDHTVEMKLGGPEAFLSEYIWNADVDDLHTVSYEGDVRKYKTANAISKALVAKGPFKRNALLADREFMYHCFFGEQTRGRFETSLDDPMEQALLAASV